MRLEPVEHIPEHVRVRASLAPRQVRDIRRRAENETYRKIAKDHPVGKEMVGKVANRDFYQWVD
jgi:hypothetical protein